MKKLQVVVFLMLLAASALADSSGTLVFGGMMMEGDRQVVTGVGIPTGPFHTLVYADASTNAKDSVSDDNAANIELAWFIPVSKSIPDLKIGLLTGTNVLWEPGDSPANYAVGASGFIASYKFLWVGAKYRYPFDSKAPTGRWQTGAGVHVWLK